MRTGVVTCQSRPWDPFLGVLDGARELPPCAPVPGAMRRAGSRTDTAVSMMETGAAMVTLRQTLVSISAGNNIVEINER